MPKRLMPWMLFVCVAALPLKADGPSAAVAGPPSLDLAADWPWWRGPTRDGVAAAGQKPPLEWSETKNVLWGSAIPGRGHGSPIVVGNQVVLATADLEQQTQLVVCLDRRTGGTLWQSEIHKDGFEKKGNAKSTLASATLASDGERLFVNFVNAGAIYLTALDRSGQKLWQSKVSDFVMHQGFGASPAIFDSLVIVASDNQGGGEIAAFERTTGKLVWKQSRPAKPNYVSPILLEAAGRQQLVFCGCDMVSSFDPASGTKLWEVEGSTTECVTSIVTDGKRVFVSGGYPRNHVAAVRADGSGNVDWEKKEKVYVPSMIVRDGYLYAIQDDGIAACWKSDTGQEIWKARIGGKFTSSLVLVGDNLLATSEAGRTHVFEASPNPFKLIQENQLGDECLATPAVCGGRIYFRVAKQLNGKRQEMVYCIGAKP